MQNTSIFDLEKYKIICKCHIFLQPFKEKRVGDKLLKTK